MAADLVGRCGYDNLPGWPGGTVSISALEASLTLTTISGGCHCIELQVTKATGAWAGVSGTDAWLPIGTPLLPDLIGGLSLSPSYETGDLTFG